MNINQVVAALRLVEYYQDCVDDIDGADAGVFFELDVTTGDFSDAFEFLIGQCDIPHATLRDESFQEILRSTKQRLETFEARTILVTV